MSLMHISIFILSVVLRESRAECEREEECEFEKLKRDILIFFGAILGFALVMGLCTYLVYKLYKMKYTDDVVINETE